MNIAFAIPFKEDNHDYYLKTFTVCLFFIFEFFLVIICMKDALFCYGGLNNSWHNLIKYINF